jgi:CRISPR-associated protein Cas5t
MFIFQIDAHAETASFRIPEHHTFQKTLPLPPITTLIGFMGAALGLSYEDAINYRKEQQIYLGVIGNHTGEMKDLWKHIKKRRPTKTKSRYTGDVLIRESLIDFSFSVFIGCQQKEILKEIRKSFQSPYYALTAGNSDDLVKIQKIHGIVELGEKEIKEFENTVLPKDQTADYEVSVDIANKPITYRIDAPLVYLLPTDFSFDGKERRVSEREHFTFVGSPIQLQTPLSGYQLENRNFMLL